MVCVKHLKYFLFEQFKIAVFMLVALLDTASHPRSDEQQITTSATLLYHPVDIVDTSSSLKHSQNLEMDDNYGTITNNTKQQPSTRVVMDSTRTSKTDSEINNSLCLPLTSMVPCATGNLQSVKSETSSKKISESIEKTPQITDKDNIKKSSKFHPVLSLVSCKIGNNNNSNLKKEQDSSSGRHSENSENSTARYGDSSKVVNLSKVPDYSETKENVVKKRKPTKNAIKYAEKRLSDQEERDLEILDNLYSQIDQNVPEEYLTTHQKYILKVKDAFDNDSGNPKLKPVAKKTKDKLAISKPLLTSVLNNPKLKEITEDRNMVDVENSDIIEDQSAVSQEFKKFASSDPNFSKRYEMVLNPEANFDDTFHQNLEFNYYNYDDRRKSVTSFKPEMSMMKSKSLDDIYYRNSVSYDDSDDIYSSVDNVVNSEIKYSEDIKFENLETLYAKIDLNKPDNQFTKEERFVIKLKQSLDEMGRKNTLRKMAKKQKKLKISQPTEISIMTNPRLVSILNDPNIRRVDESTKTERRISSELESSRIRPKLFHKKSISYEDLNLLNFKIPRAKLISSTPNIAEMNKDSSSEKSEDLTNKSGRYKKNRQDESTKIKTAPFYRVKRSYDLQVMRHPNDTRKLSFNGIEPDSEAISILERYTNFENLEIEESNRSSSQTDMLEIREMEEPQVSKIEDLHSKFLKIEEQDYEIKNSNNLLQTPKLEIEEMKKPEISQTVKDFKIEDSYINSLEAEELKIMETKNVENRDLVQRTKSEAKEVENSVVSHGQPIRTVKNFKIETPPMQIEEIDQKSKTSDDISEESENAPRRSFIETKIFEIKRAKKPPRTFITTKQFEIAEAENPILIAEKSKNDGLPKVPVEEAKENHNHSKSKTATITEGSSIKYNQIKKPELEEFVLKLEDLQTACLKTKKDIQNEFSRNNDEFQNSNENTESNQMKINKDGVNEETESTTQTANDEKSFINKQEENFSTKNFTDLEIEDTDLDFGSVIIRKTNIDNNSNISEVNSEDEEILSSLKSKLDDDEFDLIQRIQSNPEFNRPDSGLNEEDLKLIAFAQRQCSQEQNNEEDNSEEQIMKIESSSTVEDSLSSQIKDSDLDSHDQDAPVNFLRNSKIRSSLNEPVYMNYSVFLKEMIHEDDKDRETSCNPRKQPLPLPRSKSINESIAKENKNEISNKINEDDICSQNYDNLIVSSLPSDISKITSDISNLTNNLKDLEEGLDIKQDMIADNDCDTNQNDLKVFGNIEKYFALHASAIEDENSVKYEDITEIVSNDKICGNTIEYTKSQKAIEYKKRHKHSKKHRKEKTKFNVDDDGKPIDTHESDRTLSSFCSYRSEDVTEKNPEKIKTFKEVVTKDEIEKSEKDESQKRQVLEVIKESEDNVNPEISINTRKDPEIFKDECTNTNVVLKEEATHVNISREMSREEGTSTNINSEKIKFENETNSRASSPTNEGFSIKAIIGKLGSLISGATSPKPTTTTTYVNTGFVENKESPIHNTGFIKDIPTDDVAHGTVNLKDTTIQATEPVIIEHHLQDKNITDPFDYLKDKSPYDTLERISFFHVLNNPPKSYPHHHHHHHTPIPPMENDIPKCLIHDVHPVNTSTNQNLFSSTQPSLESTNRSSIEYAIKRFEDMIQSTQQQPCLQFKSEIMKKATVMTLRKLNNEQSNMQTDIQTKSQSQKPNENIDEIQKGNVPSEEPNEDKKYSQYNFRF